MRPQEPDRIVAGWNLHWDGPYCYVPVEQVIGFYLGTGLHTEEGRALVDALIDGQPSNDCEPGL